jgi:hypothetical protein
VRHDRDLLPLIGNISEGVVQRCGPDDGGN